MLLHTHNTQTNCVTLSLRIPFPNFFVATNHIKFSNLPVITYTVVCTTPIKSQSHTAHTRTTKQFLYFNHSLWTAFPAFQLCCKSSSWNFVSLLMVFLEVYPFFVLICFVLLCFARFFFSSNCAKCVCLYVVYTVYSSCFAALP